MTYEDHPAAALFPLMEGKEFDELVADLTANGLRDPIVLYEGKILDGRNRSRACAAAGVDPRYVTWTPKDGESPVSYVRSVNLHRRHLTHHQRTVAAAKATEMYAAEAKARQVAGLKQGDESPVSADSRSRDERCPSAPLLAPKGKTSHKVAAEYMVSPRGVEAAKAVLATGVPELVEAMEREEIGVHAAAEVASLPPEEQREAVAGGGKAVSKSAKRVREKKKLSTFETRPRKPKTVTIKIVVNFEKVKETLRDLRALGLHPKIQQRGA